MTICPDCEGMGVVADPEVMQLIMAGLLVDRGHDAIDDELKRRRKISGRTGRYWMVGPCPRCGGTGQVP